MTQVLNAPDDLVWFRSVLLSQCDPVPPAPGAVVLYGNEDCPEGFDLYASAEPRITDPFRRYKMSDDGFYRPVPQL